jgi:FkbM family methyltransferase
MKSQIKGLLNAALGRFDLRIEGHSRLLSLEGLVHSLEQYDKDIIAAISSLPRGKLATLGSLLPMSHSQIWQDLFVLTELDFKKNGYYVEFGATNGVDLSNTYLLEKSFGWNGILAEPAKYWHDALKANRTCSIETNCVWRDSTSVLNFNEVQIPELSTITSFRKTDLHASRRNHADSYSVNTISLNDLLDKYGAPREIDYLSIDTEGSEFEILNNCDFAKYSFKVITCEHNFSPIREKILSLLTRHGYIRKFIGLSKWDDWYTKSR